MASRFSNLLKLSRKITLHRFFFCFLLTMSWSGIAKSLDYLAYGDLRGYLEPCGCDPLTDLGGIKRIKYFIDSQRRLRPETLVFDLGNNLPPLQNAQGEKVPFIIEATKTIAPIATLFSQTEWQHFSALSTTQFAASIPYVLSNRASKTPHSKTLNNLIKSSIEIKLSRTQNDTRKQVAVSQPKSARIFGYVSPEKMDLPLRKASSQLIAEWKKIQTDKGKVDDFTVLLFRGSDKDLKFFQASNQFDIIIPGNNRPLEEDPSDVEKLNEQLLLRPQQIPMVPLGGQGILLGGSFTKSGPLTLKGLLDAPNDSTNTPTTELLPIQLASETPAANQLFHWLPRATESESEFSSLFKRYDIAAEKKLVALSKKRVDGLKNSPFIGSAKCQTCHVKAYKAWQQSAHASAYNTLVEKGKDKHLECITCHVLGAKVAGGFVSAELSPHLKNVQCETCHGPRRNHVERKLDSNRMTTEKDDLPSHLSNPKPTNCVRCHHSPHSSRFDFETYWKKIAH